ncbi:DMT family transporter [Micromonospora sp. NPDC023956]|uniref:DMT family transporter n=1 Tax=Micromonospora sp. NPDC023956 TaxID=3155722 RepID=UPI0033EE0BF0
MRPADLAGLISLAVIWGTNFLFVELALEGTGPSGLVLGRMILGSAVLLLLARIRRVSLPEGRRAWLLIAGMSLFAQAVPLVLFATGQQQVTAALAGVYSGATPLLTIPIVWLFLGSRPSAGEILASVVGFAGLAVVLSPWDTAGGSYVGQLFCLAGAVCFGLAYAYTAKVLVLVKGDKLALAAAQAVSGVALLLPVTLVTEGPGRGPALHPTVLVVAAIVAMGLGSAAAFVINYWLVDRIGPVQASLAFYLTPIVAVAAGFAVRGERLTAHEAVGSAIVLAALGLLYAFKRSRIPAGGPAGRTVPPVSPADAEPARPAPLPPRANTR